MNLKINRIQSTTNTLTHNIIMDEASLLQIFIPTEKCNSELILACLFTMETKRTVCLTYY